MTLSVLAYFILVGYIMFWLTDFFKVVYELSPLVSMIVFLTVLITGVVLGLLVGGYIADQFVKYNNNS